MKWALLLFLPACAGWGTKRLDVQMSSEVLLQRGERLWCTYEGDGLMSCTTEEGGAAMLAQKNAKKGADL